MPCGHKCTDEVMRTIFTMLGRDDVACGAHEHIERTGKARSEVRVTEAGQRHHLQHRGGGRQGVERALQLTLEEDAEFLGLRENRVRTRGGRRCETYARHILEEPLEHCGAGVAGGRVSGRDTNYPTRPWRACVRSWADAPSGSWRAGLRWTLFIAALVARGEEEPQHGDAADEKAEENFA